MRRLVSQPNGDSIFQRHLVNTSRKPAARAAAADGAGPADAADTFLAWGRQDHDHGGSKSENCLRDLFLPRRQLSTSHARKRLGGSSDNSGHAENVERKPEGRDPLAIVSSLAPLRHWASRGIDQLLAFVNDRHRS